MDLLVCTLPRSMLQGKEAFHIQRITKNKPPSGSTSDHKCCLSVQMAVSPTHMGISFSLHTLSKFQQDQLSISLQHGYPTYVACLNSETRLGLTLITKMVPCGP